jgi:hypothetical protein
VQRGLAFMRLGHAMLVLLQVWYALQGEVGDSLQN